MRKGTINMYLFHSLDHKEANQQILIKVLVSDFLKKKGGEVQSDRQMV